MQNTENQIEDTTSMDALLHRAGTRFLNRDYENVILDCTDILPKLKHGGS